MGELNDKAKGKAKEIAGVVTGDRDLEAEGKADIVKGKVKGAFETAKQRVKDAVNPPDGKL
ncbi:MAG: CsbD family protein [Clostridia bacterium]|nr:CsbD family protein [Deltaproteobacteria bacterium]